ncbi:MAG: hypothetical protein OXU41_07890, partial [Gammaproteobacteria bacterium]|nr:hypothetical protein [Gammaproteobacteria bacterium]
IGRRETATAGRDFRGEKTETFNTEYIGGLPSARDITHMLNTVSRGCMMPPHSGLLRVVVGDGLAGGEVACCVEAVVFPECQGAVLLPGGSAHVCLLHCKRSHMVEPAHPEADVLYQHVGFLCSAHQKIQNASGIMQTGGRRGDTLVRPWLKKFAKV